MSAHRLSRLSVAAMAVLWLAPLPTAAQTAQAEQTRPPADVRAELSGLLRAMQALPAEVRSQVYPASFPWAEAERAIALDPRAEEALTALFGPGAEAQGVPGALQILGQGIGSRGGAGLAPARLQPEAFRANLLGMTATLRRLGDDLPPELAASLDGFDAGIQALSSEQLATVMLGLAPARSRLAGARDGLDPNVAAAMSDCTGGFPEKEICQIGALFDTVSSFFTETLPHFFTVQAPEAILGALQALVDLALELIPSPEELVGLFGLDEPDWNAIAGALPSGVFFGPPPGSSAASSSAPAGVGPAAAAASGVQLPCPDEGTNIFPFGEMGDIESYYSCKRTAEWLLRALFKTSPKDGEGLAVKIGVGLVYFPVKYLCGCFEKSWFVPFWEDQLLHVADMTSRMDVPLSTRATQSELDGAAGQGLILDTAADTALELSEDLDARLAALTTAGDEGTELQEELMEQRLTHLVEVDLARQPNGPAVGLFQLPAAHGGLLEKAAAIAAGAVAEARERGGNVKNAEGSLAAGAALQAAGSFKGAYQLYRYAYQQALAAMR